MQILEGLLLATGFTGALTLTWLIRLVWDRLRPPLEASVAFSPHGGCTDVIVREIGLARKEILMLAYGFTSRPVAQALVDAKLHGVHVQVILDHSNETDPHSEMAHLLEQGLVPMIDAHHTIAHNKVIVIDGKTVVTGSFNFTNNAESHNAENLVVLRHHVELARAFRKDFDLHREHSRPAGGATTSASGNTSHLGHSSADSATQDDPLESVARSVAGVEAEDKGSPRMTAAASEVFAKLRKQMGDKADERAEKKSRAA